MRFINTENYFPLWNWKEYVDNRLNGDWRRGNQVKKFLDDNKDIQGMTGEQASQDPSIWDEVVDLLGYDHLTWRSWGSLMAAYMNEKEKKRKYCYMDFYM